MNDRALSEEAMLAGLRDIRLPAEAPGGVIAEMALGVGIGGILALVVLAVLRVLSARRAVSAPVAQGDMSEGARRVAMLHRLKVAAPEVFARLRGRLYRRGALKTDEIAAEVARID